ncbi:MAG: gephyrin-like molybdotransferase Glp [Myxococcota bacterium]
MTEEVRLKGFGRRAPYREVYDWLQTAVTPLGVERVSFREAVGRVLAQDVRARGDVPRFARAAMDGYAVRARDIPGALRLQGELMAADSSEHGVKAHHTLRIMTGARIPDDADAVVMVEHATVEGDIVRFDSPTPAGQHILRVGEDIADGQVILPAGRRLRPSDTAMLVQAGVFEVAVRRRPRIVILPTGTELQPVGVPLTANQVPETNSFMLEALAHRDGAEPVLHPIVHDDVDTLRRAMVSSGADILLLSGGSSVGSEDYAPVIANEVGQVAFHGIALKPGSSTGIGRIGSTWVVLGPGYPVAAFTAWELLVRPLIFALLGTADRWPYPKRKGRMAAAYKKRPGRTELARVVLNDGDPPLVTPLPGGSALLSTLTNADGFLLLDDDTGPLNVGDEVTVHVLST